jgi:hypothetical protein
MMQLYATASTFGVHRPPDELSPLHIGGECLCVIGMPAREGWAVLDVRQLLDRKREAWIAESGTERIRLIRYPAKTCRDSRPIYCRPGKRCSRYDHERTAIARHPGAR